MSPGDWDRLREAVQVAIVGFEPRIHTLWLYGSRAMGTENEESDFDFAVASDRRLESPERMDLFRRLGDVLDSVNLGWNDIDAVDLQAVPLTLAAQVLTYGKVLFCSDDRARAFLETRLMSMYASLNEERREVIEAIVERGRIYA